MQKKKEKAIKIKARDLKPAKDAKGGHHVHHGHQFTSLVNQNEDPHAPGGGLHSVQ